MEGLLSTGPTPSSFSFFNISREVTCVYCQHVVTILCIFIDEYLKAKALIHFKLTCLIAIPKMFSERTVDNHGLWKPSPEQSILFTLMHFLNLVYKMCLIE